MLATRPLVFSGLTVLAVTAVSIAPAHARFYSSYTARDFQFDYIAGTPPTSIGADHFYDVVFQVTAIRDPLDPPEFGYDYTGIDDPWNFIELTYLKLNDPINGIFASGITGAADVPANVTVDSFGDIQWSFDLGLSRSLTVNIDAAAKAFELITYQSGDGTQFMDYIDMSQFERVDVQTSPEPGISLGLAVMTCMSIAARRWSNSNQDGR